MMESSTISKQPIEKKSFSEILKKENCFIRIPRKPFIDFSFLEDRLNSFSFGKTEIESWDFAEKIEEIFLTKLDSSKSAIESEALLAIKEDTLSILEESFKFSKDYRPNEVSLSLVKGVPCTKLHADFLPLRLICTYFGVGTIFLPKESTRYPCLNEGRPNKRVLIKGKPQLQAKPFEILILKGRKFNKGELRPCAHRSPEVEGNKLRLVLKVDFK